MFNGIAQFEGAATGFLAEGAARKERLMFVADDPKLEQWPTELLERGGLVVASTTEIYGPREIVVAASQKQTYARALADALRDGFSGLRVAADNTSLITGPEPLAAWLVWEATADEFMADNPMTALCAFDRTRADQSSIDAVMAAHRVGE